LWLARVVPRSRSRRPAAPVELVVVPEGWPAAWALAVRAWAPVAAIPAPKPVAAALARGAATVPISAQARARDRGRDRQRRRRARRAACLALQGKAPGRRARATTHTAAAAWARAPDPPAASGAPGLEVPVAEPVVGARDRRRSAGTWGQALVPRCPPWARRIALT
jgi:hypothetical protein